MQQALEEKAPDPQLKTETKKWLFALQILTVRGGRDPSPML
jgi:hypothetical protein